MTDNNSQIFNSITASERGSGRKVKPTSLERGSGRNREKILQQRQQKLGLGRWNNRSVLPDVGRNQGDPRELI